MTIFLTHSPRVSRIIWMAPYKKSIRKINVRLCEITSLHLYKYHSLLKWEASSLGKKVYLRQTVIERNREAAFSINKLRDRQISACKLANWWKKNLPSHQFHETWLLSNTYEVCLHLKYLKWNRKCTSKDSLNLFLIWFRLKKSNSSKFSRPVPTRNNSINASG